MSFTYSDSRHFNTDIIREQISKFVLNWENIVCSFVFITKHASYIRLKPRYDFQKLCCKFTTAVIEDAFQAS